MTPVRFRDPRSETWHFRDAILVRCPRCDRLAHLDRSPGPAPRLICRSCGLSKESPLSPCPSLWLSAETRHGELWAYNLEHLDVIRRFVAADLRERAPWYDTGRKMTLVARLPAWVKSGRNRTEVLRVIDRMRASVTAR